MNFHIYFSVLAALRDLLGYFIKSDYYLGLALRDSDLTGPWGGAWALGLLWRRWTMLISVATRRLLQSQYAGFSCPEACGILVLQPGIKPTSAALEVK